MGRSISNGETDGYQKITVTGSNNFTDPFFGFSITYGDGASTATLTLTPDDIETKQGVFLVKIFVKDGGGTRNNGVDTTSITFKVIVTEPNGVEEASKKNGFTIYPNPADQVLHIQSANIVDNVTLLAASMGMYDFPTNDTFWEMMAYCTGTGGSCLIIGSAAGVAVMGMENISFSWYFKNISWLAFAGYFAGFLIYNLQNLIFT